MDPYLFKRLLRRPWISLCTVFISLVLCVLISYIFSYRDEQKIGLEEAVQSYDVLCVVTDAKGTKSSGLRMDESYMDFVMDPESSLAPYISDLRITKEFKFSDPGYGISTLGSVDYTPLTGVISERCSDTLNPEFGAEITYLEEDFYERTDYICILSEELYYELGEEKTIRLNVTDPVVDQNREPGVGKGTIEFKAVGYYPGRGSSIFMPFGAALKLSEEISGRVSCDSISFIASDNRKLDMISSAASEKFGAADPLAHASDESFALIIFDEQYRSSVAAMEQNIRRTDILIPLLFLLGAGTGFLASFLSTRNENRTYALMRTLGMTFSFRFCGNKLFRQLFRHLRHRFLPGLLSRYQSILHFTLSAVPPAHLKSSKRHPLRF